MQIGKRNKEEERSFLNGPEVNELLSFYAEPKIFMSYTSSCERRNVTLIF